MSRTIDCLVIGHNEMQFAEYEKMVGSMGTDSEAYRDLNLNFIRHDNRAYAPAEIFNMFYDGGSNPLNLGDTFSAAVSYLCTYIHRRGFTFDYINSFQGEKNALSEMLQKDTILTIAVTTTLYTSSFPIQEIMNFIRKYNRTAKVIVGGPFISTNVRMMDNATLQYIFESIGADFYINSSQGEAALVNIIGAVKNNLSPERIDNIYYKTGSGYAATPVSIEDNRLEENMVDWHLFADRIGEFAALRTAISCPFSCAFCGFPQRAGKYQTASVEAVERELDAIHSIGKVKSINFIDDTFNVPPQRFKDILRMMIKNKYQFKWHSYFRCQYADLEMIELMKESGCEGVFLGVESGNRRILENMNKSATPEQYREGIRLLKEQEIVTFVSLIVGFPGETRETVQDTVRFVEESQPDFYRAQLWYCEPITPIWEQKSKYGIRGSQFKWSHTTMDSKTGCDLIDAMVLSVKNSIWLPQYNFDFVNIFHLLHRGMSLEQVKEFVSGFEAGLREKLREPGRKEASSGVIERIERACRKGMTPGASTGQGNSGGDIAEKYDADFDF